MRTITVFNHKGGCGKTTTAINLAAALAEAGHSVLLVDLDAQAHATIGCGVREEEVELSAWDVFRGTECEDGELKLADVAWEIRDRFFLAPSTVALATLEQTLAGEADRERKLQDALAAVADRYEFAVIDCGPGIGLLSVNALVAADEVILPVDLGYFSVYGLGRALETIDMIAGRTGREPGVHILATMYDTRARTMRRTLQTLREQHGERMLETVIRFNVALREAAARGGPVMEFHPGSRGHQDYLALGREIAPPPADLQAAYEAEQQAEADAEAALDARIELVYGPTPIDGGVRFVTEAPEAERVEIAGDFNGWDLSGGGAEMNRIGENGAWQREFRLPPGRYAYRLVVDGRWMSDPANPYVESNPYGELNSVVEVQ